jgi:outer membrane lipoprotein SlyB
VVQAGTSTGLGAAIGAVAGGLAGDQVGGGSGNTIATAAGVIGGAVLGNTIERNRSSGTMYEVVIAMDNGAQQTIIVPDVIGISLGAAVNVQGGSISLR